MQQMLQRQQVGLLTRLRQRGGGTVPPKKPAGPSEVELWLSAVKASKRLALAVPIMAFVALLLPAQFNAEVSLGSTKIKPIAGHRELAIVGIALLIVKLARDANRLMSFRSVAELDLDLSAKVGFESFIKRDYARPIDLVGKRDPQLEPKSLAPLKRIESARRVLMFTLGSLAAMFTLAAIVNMLRDMILAPGLEPTLSCGLSALILGLFVVAAFDLAEIGLLPWVIRHDERKRKADAEREKQTPRHGAEWCKREAASIGEPLPEPWPPSDADIRKFEDRIRARRLEKLDQTWDSIENRWRSRSDSPRRRITSRIARPPPASDV
jgi:hypothetical protein